MANGGDDVHARATLEVDVQGADKLQQVNRELDKIKAAGGRAPVPTAAAPAAAVPGPTAAAPPHLYPWQTRAPTGPKASEWVAQQLGLPPERELPRATPAEAAAAGLRPWQTRVPTGPRAAEWVAQQEAHKAASAAGEATFAGVQDVFGAKGPGVKAQLGNFVQAISGTAAGAAQSAAQIGVVVAGLATIAAPIASFVAGLKVLRWSFEGAQEAAENQIKLAGRTQRTMPGAMGAALEGAEEEMRTRMGVATALFGDAADGMQQQMTKRMSDYRLGRGLRGEQDIFSRWGITPQSIKTYESLAGQRLDVTEWLRLFILKREELQTNLEKAQTPEERTAIQRRLAQLSDDAAKIVNDKFADTLNTLSSRDLARLQQNLSKAVPLGKVEQATRRSVNFNISFLSLMGTFKAIKEGVVGDTQPAITSFLEVLNKKLLDTDKGGEGLGRMFRDLAISMANKAWDALREIMDKIKPETITGWIKIIQSWSPKDTAENMKTIFSVFAGLAKAALACVKVIEAFIGVLPTWLTGSGLKGIAAEAGTVREGEAPKPVEAAKKEGAAAVATVPAGAAPETGFIGSPSARALARSLETQEAAPAAGAPAPPTAVAAPGPPVQQPIAQPAAAPPAAQPPAVVPPAGTDALTQAGIAPLGQAPPTMGAMGLGAGAAAPGAPVRQPITQPAAAPPAAAPPPPQEPAPGPEKGWGDIFEEKRAAREAATKPPWHDIKGSFADNAQRQAMQATAAGAAVAASTSVERGPGGDTLKVHTTAKGYYVPGGPILTGEAAQYKGSWKPTGQVDLAALGMPGWYLPPFAPPGTQAEPLAQPTQSVLMGLPPPSPVRQSLITEEDGYKFGTAAGEGMATRLKGAAIANNISMTSYGVGGRGVQAPTGGDPISES